MKKTLFVAILLINTICFASAPEKYSRVKISINKTEIFKLGNIGIPLEDGHWNDNGLIIEISETEILALKKANISYQILIEDMEKYYVERNLADKTEKALENLRGNTSTSCYFERNKVNPSNPINFQLGSIAGYLTITELNNWLANMHNSFPNLITAATPIDTTKSIERRDLNFVKISSNVKTGNKPKILYTGLTHAREPMGMQQMVYFIAYLLENYGKNELVTQIVDNTDLYFIPCINPDGYNYNIVNSPNGGGMNRKNMRKNADNTIGVDLNRNFGYNWGYDDYGSSPYPGADNYRGASAFSEPETSAYRNFCNKNNFNLVINYHTYGNDFIHPWGNTTKLGATDSTIYKNLSSVITRDNKYNEGTVYETLGYTTNGGSDDWVFGQTNEHTKAFSFTPEIGMQSDGFWAPQSRILNICRENVTANLRAALLAGSFAELKDRSTNILSKQQGFIPYEFYNTGVNTPSTFDVRIHIIGTDSTTDSRKTYINCVPNQSFTDSLSYNLPSSKIGNAYTFILSVSNRNWTLRDTLVKYYGNITNILTDSCKDINNWTTTNWGISPNNGITDIKNGAGTYISNSILTLKNSIDLQNVITAQLLFDAKWNIEKQVNYVQVQVSSDGGNNWQPLCGRYTSRGFSTQIEEMPVYDRAQNNYVKEMFDLTDYVGSIIQLRFISNSISGNQGFYMKNININSLNSVTSSINKITLNDLKINLIPNPCSTDLTVISEKENINRVIIYNSLGIEVLNSTNTNNINSIKINTEILSSGIYFIKTTTNSGKSSVNRFIKQ